MKGLIIKDYYMMMRYCRMFFFIVVVFELAAAFLGDGLFLIVYPLIISSVIPLNLLSYDEKSRWTTYSCTIPYSRGQLVSVKYIYALGLCAACEVFMVIVQLIGAAANGGTAVADPYILAMMLLPIGLIPAAILLPVAFWLGTEKGRIAFYAIIVILCALFGVLGANSLNTSADLVLRIAARPVMLMGIDLVALGIFGVSWVIAMELYKRREL